MQRPARSRIAPLIIATTALCGLAACGEGTAPPATDDTKPIDTMGSAALTDADIRGLAEPDSTWTWWEHSDSLLDRAGNSPHGDRIRVRYNGQAATQLDSAGRVRADADFPDRSAVVKEVFVGGIEASILVMYKAEGDPHAGHGSWLWGEYAADDGEPLHSITQDDGYCHNCHVAGNDHMRMNDTH